MDGAWIEHGNPVMVPMAEDVLIGLAVTSHDAATMSTVTFDRSCSTDFLATDVISDKVINFKDYAELMTHWLEEVPWPQ